MAQDRWQLQLSWWYRAEEPASYRRWQWCKCPWAGSHATHAQNEYDEHDQLSLENISTNSRGAQDEEEAEHTVRRVRVQGGDAVLRYVHPIALYITSELTYPLVVIGWV